MVSSKVLPPEDMRLNKKKVHIFWTNKVCFINNKKWFGKEGLCICVHALMHMSTRNSRSLVLLGYTIHQHICAHIHQYVFFYKPTYQSITSLTCPSIYLSPSLYSKQLSILYFKIWIFYDLDVYFGKMIVNKYLGRFWVLWYWVQASMYSFRTKWHRY